MRTRNAIEHRDSSHFNSLCRCSLIFAPFCLFQLYFSSLEFGTAISTLVCQRELILHTTNKRLNTTKRCESNKRMTTGKSLCAAALTSHGKESAKRKTTPTPGRASLLFEFWLPLEFPAHKLQFGSEFEFVFVFGIGWNCNGICVVVVVVIWGHCVRPNLATRKRTRRQLNAE